MNFGLEEYIEILVLGLIVTTFLLFVIILILMIKMAKSHRRTKRLWQSTNKEEVESKMLKLLDEISELRSINENNTKEIFDLRRKLNEQIANVAIVRYNAFGDRGNDLSYSIALLNENFDGVVMTSIYNREQSTTYAKPITRGDSVYTLSDEEKNAINQLKSKGKSQ